ncbi:Uncharacterized protein MCB1EB_2052 [Mycoavidus cysteinexigens]|uniref:Uncharacterized protein n=1 Tax=Mycoavidus cysteinexigens TaxID=1553431 RepID=A0A2Z6EXM6_9BURK|nr:Uncharacterized protein MCB1EB_2052 [Mycoavidus cysteinexigens]GLR00630.1 hypothetical protein GCM10007934_04410 [Mycoavidus cysteinexigens]
MSLSSSLSDSAFVAKLGEVGLYGEVHIFSPLDELKPSIFLVSNTPGVFPERFPKEPVELLLPRLEDVALLEPEEAPKSSVSESGCPACKGGELKVRRIAIYPPSNGPESE